MYSIALAYEELKSLNDRIDYLEKQTPAKDVTVELVEAIIAKQNVEEEIAFLEEACFDDKAVL